VISITNIVGMLVVLLGAGLVFLFSFPIKGRTRRTLRPIAALQRLRRAIGLAVEDGKRLHVSTGSSSILSTTNASALVGLSTLERVAQLSMASDRPPVATSGDPVLAILGQDSLRAAYRIGNAADQYDPDRSRLVAPSPLAYTAGTIPIIHSDTVSTNILIGNFGPEVAFLAEEADRQNAFCLAASDSLPAQAVLFAAAQEPLIGEELFAVPAYLQAGPYHYASLRVQDILRWGVVVVIVVGAFLKLVGIV
jgi:hypothetical protein